MRKQRVYICHDRKFAHALHLRVVGNDGIKYHPESALLARKIRARRALMVFNTITDGI